MKVTPISENCVAISGHIDSNNAADFARLLESSLDERADPITLDAGELEYISSAGLRVLMKLKKRVTTTVNIINVNASIAQIFEITGFSRLFNVQKAYRRLSVDGCDVIGKGFYGTVYRYDADTIVKVYHSPDSIHLIENEQRMAKLAFLKGIPTAISYDIVRVGDTYGSVFELLKSKTFNDLVIEHPDKVDDIVEDYTEFLKLVHATEVDRGELPSARDRFMGYLEQIGTMISEAQRDQLRKLLQTLPDDLHVVHGDFQMKNVMLSEGEPMLIDMDTLAAGCPIFDLAGLFVTYQMFDEDAPGNSMAFLGIPFPTATRIWEKLLELYLGTTDKTELNRASDKIRIVAAIRFLYILSVSDLKQGELGQRRISHTRQHIDELLRSVDTLVL